MFVQDTHTHRHTQKSSMDKQKEQSNKLNKGQEFDVGSHLCLGYRLYNNLIGISFFVPSCIFFFFCVECVHVLRTASEFQVQSESEHSYAHVVPQTRRLETRRNPTDSKQSLNNIKWVSFWLWSPPKTPPLFTRLPKPHPLPSALRG